jgi:hypothetical protein
MPYKPDLQDLAILISRAFKSGDIAKGPMTPDSQSAVS